MKRSFSASEMVRRPADVLHQAANHPVSITKHDKPKFVLMSQEYYEQIMNNNPRQSYHSKELPETLHKELESGISAYLEE